MQIVGLDQSLRGFGIARAEVFANGWEDVRLTSFDGGELPRKASEALQARRQDILIHRVTGFIAEVNPDLVAFESYAFSRNPNVEVVELCGALKRWLRQVNIPYLWINQSSARKLLLGKVPRKGKDAKNAVYDAFIAAGVHAATLDESDALCILNAAAAESDMFCYAQSAR